MEPVEQSFTIDGVVLVLDPITNPVGRPTKRDASRVKKLQECFEIGCNISEACLISGISRQQFYIWMKVDTEFADKMNAAQKFVTVSARRNIYDAIKAKDKEMSKWWMERKVSEEFGRKDSLMVGVDAQTEINKILKRIEDDDEPKQIPENT